MPNGIAKPAAEGGELLDREFVDDPGWIFAFVQDPMDLTFFDDYLRDNEAIEPRRITNVS